MIGEKNLCQWEGKTLVTKEIDAKRQHFCDKNKQKYADKTPG